MITLLFSDDGLDLSNGGGSCRNAIRRETKTEILKSVRNMGIGIFYGDFGMIYALVGDNGMLYDATDVIDTYVFRTMRVIGSPSQAMAISLFQACMGFICVWGTNFIARKKFSEGALF